MNLDYVMFAQNGRKAYGILAAGLYTGQGIQIKRRYYNVKT